MTKFYLFNFYILFLYVLFDRAKSLMIKNQSNNFLDLSNSQSSMLLLILILITFALTLMASVYPKTIIRFAVAVFMSFLLLVYYWGAHMSHTYHAWVICLYVMCFLNADQELDKGNNLSIIRLAQSLLLSHYFIAGLWKVRTMFAFDNLTVFLNYPLDLVASSLAEGQWINYGIIVMIKEWPGVIVFGWMSVVVFQLSTIVPIIKGRGYMVWGLLALGFHFIGGLFLGVWFAQTVLTLLFFLVITEGLLVYMKTKTLSFFLIGKS